MSSGGGTHAHRAMASYDAAKGGVEALTRAMALDLAPYGIRVNCIVPGLIRTYDIDDELAHERGEVVPLRRLGTADDVAGPTLFLATDDARYVTGVTLRVDGGVLVQQRSAPVDVYPVSRFPQIALAARRGRVERDRLAAEHRPGGGAAGSDRALHVAGRPLVGPGHVERRLVRGVQRADGGQVAGRPVRDVAERVRVHAPVPPAASRPARPARQTRSSEASRSRVATPSGAASR